jgi:hypothetical protein
MIKIAVGIPTNRLIKPKMASSLLKMVMACKHEYLFIVSTRGFNTSENRNYIATKAVNEGCTHLFFVDDDMIIPEDTLDRLLEHDKDIVGGVYLTKYEVQEPVLEYLDDNRPDSLFEVKAIGTGCMLIKTGVFKAIPQCYKDCNGWFNYIWNPNGSVKMSHDWLFCQNARELGIKIYADPTLDIKHIGLKKY